MFLFRFVLLYLLFKFHCYGKLELEVYRSFCPFTNFCSNSSFPVIKHQDFQGGQVPCCLPCYCDKQCWAFSDCCPDEQKVDDFDLNSKATCQHAHYRSENFFSDGDFAWVSGQYVIQSKCPSNYTGPVADKCAEKFDKLPDLEDIAVVSDSNRLYRVYKNKYCAECNGVRDIKRWSGRTGSCKSHTIFNNMLERSEVWKYLLDNCEIQFLPLPDIPSRSVDCSTMSLRSCSNGTVHLGLDVHRACWTSSGTVHGCVLADRTRQNASHLQSELLFQFYESNLECKSSDY